MTVHMRLTRSVGKRLSAVSREGPVSQPIRRAYFVRFHDKDDKMGTKIDSETVDFVPIAKRMYDSQTETL